MNLVIFGSNFFVCFFAQTDTWDVPALLLLLQEYEARKALFNSVSGTHRQEDCYKLQ